MAGVPKKLRQQDVVAFALGLPETEKRSHMGRPDLRVCGKIFATLPENGLTVNVKSPPFTLEALVRADPETFESIWNGQMLGVALARVEPALLKSLLIEAWRNRAPKRLANTEIRPARKGKG